MKNEIKSELAALGFLGESEPESQPLLLASVSERGFQPGEVIYQHDEESNSLIVVRKGLIKLLTYLPNGQSRIVRLHKPDSMIGIDGLMNKSHSHTAVAVDAVKVFEVPHIELLSLKKHLKTDANAAAESLSYSLWSIQTQMPADTGSSIQSQTLR